MENKPASSFVMLLRKVANGRLSLYLEDRWPSFLSEERGLLAGRPSNRKTNAIVGNKFLEQQRAN